MDGLLCSVGFAVRWVDNATQALAALEQVPSPVLLDLTSEQAIANGLEIRTRYPATLIVAVANPARPAVSDRARRAGFAQVLERPLAAASLVAVFSAPEAVTALVGREGETKWPAGIVVCSAAMKEVAERVKRAGSDGAGGVLVCGEPGTGRRFLARVLHTMHCRPNGRLVEVDCAPAPGVDLETMLFGTVPDGDGPGSAHSSGGRPAFRPGASMERITRTSLVFHAFGGTLLLLNVADTPARVQGRLARVLRDGEAAIAGDGKVQGPIRVIACVEPGFDTVVDEGRVRADLFKRLAAMRIDVPPLRNRREDIPALVDQFLQDVCLLARLPRKTVSYPALTLLTSLPYRGNARELRSLIGMLVERTPAATIRLEDVLRNLRLDVAAPGGSPYAGTLRDARTRFEQQYIREVLDRHHGRIAEAAKSLGIQRTNLYRKMRALGVAWRQGSPGNGSRNEAR